MDPTRLRYLATLGAEGTLTRAARRLGITRQALGRQIALLEQEAGFSLLHRPVRPRELTPEARSLLEDAAATERAHRR